MSATPPVAPGPVQRSRSPHKARDEAGALAYRAKFAIGLAIGIFLSIEVIVIGAGHGAAPMFLIQVWAVINLFTNWQLDGNLVLLAMASVLPPIPAVIAAMVQSRQAWKEMLIFAGLLTAAVAGLTVLVSEGGTLLSLFFAAPAIGLAALTFATPLVVSARCLDYGGQRHR